MFLGFILFLGAALSVFGGLRHANTCECHRTLVCILVDISYGSRTVRGRELVLSKYLLIIRNSSLLPCEEDSLWMRKLGARKAKGFSQGHVTRKWRSWWRAEPGCWVQTGSLGHDEVQSCFPSTCSRNLMIQKVWSQHKDITVLAFSCSEFHLFPSGLLPFPHCCLDPLSCWNLLNLIHLLRPSEGLFFPKPTRPLPSESSLCLLS